MKEKRFYALGITLSIVALILGFFSFSIEALAVSIISLIVNIKKKNDFRVKIGVVITIIAMLCAIYGIIMLIIMGLSQSVSIDYWFFELLFGEFK